MTIPSKVYDEEWKSVVGYEGLYEVSNKGNVKALERLVWNNGGLQRKHERMLSPSANKFGYKCVSLCKNGKVHRRTIHRIVAEAFIPNPNNKPNVDHIDTNPSNNEVSNLRWVTQSENAMNELTRVHISESKKGHPYYRKEPLSAEAREKIRQAQLGKKRTAEQIKNRWSEEARRELGERTRKRNKERNTGRHWFINEEGKRQWT